MKSYIKLATIVAFYLALISAAFCQNVKLPYPIIFIHGYGGDETTWSQSDGNWITHFQNFGLESGGRIDITLENNTASLLDEASTDVLILTENIAESKDFYLINFHINRNGDLYPDNRFKIGCFPNPSIFSILQGNVDHIHYGDILAYDESPYTEFIKVTSEPVNNSFSVERGWGSSPTNYINDIFYVRNHSNLSNQGSIVKQGIAVKLAIQEVKIKTGASKVILICHSMGGLAARQYVQSSDFQSDVAMILTVDSPHSGSNMSDLDEFLPNILEYDGRSDAVRDLRYTTNSVNSIPPGSDDNAPYLFGGIESEVSWEDYFHFYSPYDIDGDGQISASSTLLGLNEKPWPNDVILHAIISKRLPQCFNIDDDDVVRCDRQYPNPNLVPTQLFETTWQDIDATRSCILFFLDPVHNRTHRIISEVSRGLDEPDDRITAYEIPNNYLSDSFITGFTTIQSDGNNIDTDFYKFVANSTGDALIQFYEIQNTNFWQLDIFSSLTGDPIASVTNTQQPGSNVELQFDIIDGQTYYIGFSSIALSNSYLHPYRFHVSTQLNIFTTQFDQSSYSPNTPATIIVTLGNEIEGASVSFTCNSQTYVCVDVGNGVYTKTFTVPSNVGNYPIIVSAEKSGYINSLPYNETLSVQDMGASLYPPYINLTLPNNDICHDECFITWDAVDPDNNAVIYLYYDNNNYGLNGTCINPGNPLFENSASGYSWNTVNMPEGVYWIYATIDDGTTLNSDYSPGYIEINHPDLSSDFGYSSRNVNEDEGDGDGIIEAGESFELDVWIRNLSYTTANNYVQAFLTTSNTNVEITDNDSYYGDFSPRQTKKGNDDFDIQVNNGYSGSVSFQLNIEFQNENGYSFYQIIDIPNITIYNNASPSFQIVETQIIDDGNKCNNDGILNSGENSIDYKLKLLNNGNGKAFDVEGKVLALPVEFSTSDCNADYPDISIGSSEWPKVNEDFDIGVIPYNFTGLINAELLVSWGDGTHNQLIPFSLQVFPAPRLRFSPESSDFGILSPGDTAVIPVIIWNIGTEDLIITQIENLSGNSDNWISGLTFPVTITPSDTAFAYINIKRGTATNVNETFRILSNNHTITTHDIFISGTFFEATPQGYIQAWSSDPQLNQGGGWVEPADLDNDGLIDIVTFWRSNLYFWEQTATNTLTFELKYTYTIPGVEVYIDALRIGNCDGDNKIDIVITEHDENNGNSYTARMRVFESSANNQYAQVWYSTINGTYRIEVGNCDSDINDEIIIYENARVYVYNNSGDNSYTTTWNSGTTIANYGASTSNMGYLTTGDTDKDGRKEIIFPGDDEYIFIWEKNTSGTGYTLMHDPLVTFTPDPNGTNLFPKVYDIDNDNVNEIVISGDEDGFQFTVFNPNTWSYEFNNSTGLYDEFSSPAIADLNGNGFAEVFLGGSYTDNRLIVYEYSNGSYFEIFASDPLIDYVYNIESVDLNNDGTQELIISVSDHFQVWKYEPAIMLPDLQIVSNNINFSISEPLDNDTITISALIRNIGLENANDAPVEFFQSDPSLGNRLDSLNISSLAAGNDSLVSIQWIPDQAAQFDIYVVIDRLNTIAELDLTNNIGFKSINVNDNDIIPPAFLSHSHTEIIGDADGLIEDNESIRFDWHLSDESGISSSFVVFNNCQPLNGTDSGGETFFLTLNNQATGLYPYEIHAVDNDNSPMSSVIYDTIIVYQHAPYVISNYPMDNANNIAVTDSIVVEFDIPMKATTINANTFLVFRDGNIPVIPVSVVYYPGSNKAVFEPGLLESNVSYSVKLISGPNGIKDYNNNPLETDFMWTFLTQEELLSADFIASNTVVMGGAAIAFTDLSEGNPTSWQWTFEGGTPAISYEQFPLITYNEPGLWDVSLAVGNGNGYSTLIKSDYITVNTPPSSINVTPAILAFESILIGSNSMVQTYNVAGTYLIDEITVSAPNGFSISDNSDGPWANSLILPQTGGIVDATVFVRFSPTVATAYSGNITNASAGATTQNVAVSGTGTETGEPTITVDPPLLSQTLTFAGNCPPAQTYTVSASNLIEDLTIIVHHDEGNAEISLTGEEGDYHSTITLEPENGVIFPTVIYVRNCPFEYALRDFLAVVFNSSSGISEYVLVYTFPVTGNAPVTTIANVTAEPGELVNVPVTVSDFNYLGQVQYVIEFDPTVLTFQDLANIYAPYNNWTTVQPVNSNLAQLYINLEYQSDLWMTIPDNEKLFDLVFLYAGGSSSLNFGDCSFYDSWNHLLNDEPASTYYINGSVSQANPPTIYVSVDTLIFQDVFYNTTSPPLRYLVSGINLTSDLEIDAVSDASDFPCLEISRFNESGYANSLSIPQVNGTVENTEIYVKWSAGGACYIYPYSAVLNSSTGALSKPVLILEGSSGPQVQDAPTIIIGDVGADPGSLVIVPVTAQNFSFLRNLTLVIDYNPQVITFQNCLCNIDPYYTLNTIQVSPELYRLQISIQSWNFDQTLNLPDFSKLLDLEFLYISGSTSLTLSPESYFTGQNNQVLNDEPYSAHYFNGSVGPFTKNINLTICLEGLYNEATGFMNKAQHESGNMFPGTIADRITVKLAKSTFPYNFISVYENLELNQDKTCTLQLPANMDDEYYLVINHRNSIETWSANPVAFGSDNVYYSFTQDPQFSYNSNVKLLGNSWCIYGGDVNQDDVIDTGDMTPVDNDASSFATGYLSTDVNGDGVIDTGDMTIVDNNTSGFISASYPLVPPNAVVETTQITPLSGNSVICSGNVTYQGSTMVTQRGVCWSTSTEPDYYDNHASNGLGLGAYNCQINGLTPDTQYYFRAYAYNGTGFSYGNELSCITPVFTLGEGVNDFDGNTYTSVIIGTQEWMAENLKVTHYNNGDIIPIITDNTWINLTTGAMCWYENDEATYTNPYGALYNFYAVADPRKLCPAGWHVPSDTEWAELIEFLGGANNADEKLKEAGFEHWNPLGFDADNSSGFTGLPGGRRTSNGAFSSIVDQGFWWSTNEATSATAWGRSLGYNFIGIVRNDYNKKNGNSVRCLKTVN